MPGNISRLSSAGNGKLLGFLLGASSSFFLFLIFSSMTTPADTNFRSRQNSRSQRPASKTDGICEAASNRTLGLDSIFFINLPHRHDRFDAMAIQSHIADIQVTRFAAVDASTLTNQGMPPMQKTDFLPSEKGCFRAHANVWQHMLENKIPASLVLESDAGFDAKLRPIMGRLNTAFRELLKKDNPGVAFDETNTDDPWLARSDTWDYLSIGHCLDTRLKNGSYVVYHDPDSSAKGFDVDDIEPSLPRAHKRVVYRADSIICLAGYILSLSGAARLLVRSSLNLDAPIDVLMADMMRDGQLRTYSQRQIIIPSWTFIPGIGKSGSNSDIHGNDEAEGGTEAGWDRVKKEKSAVELKPITDLVDFALGRAWHHVIGSGCSGSDVVAVSVEKVLEFVVFVVPVVPCIVFSLGGEKTAQHLTQKNGDGMVEMIGAGFSMDYSALQSR
ncbi:hypothetical protein MCOR08_001124 [Pyricularia oryzae]|nr:hypothetical protein MCOR08_001124 [Pyricularia oryzae]